jgi:hypothetical protein
MQPHSPHGDAFQHFRCDFMLVQCIPVQSRPSAIQSMSDILVHLQGRNIPVAYCKGNV